MRSLVVPTEGYTSVVSYWWFCKFGSHVFITLEKAADIVHTFLDSHEILCPKIMDCRFNISNWNKYVLQIQYRGNVSKKQYVSRGGMEVINSQTIGNHSAAFLKLPYWVKLPVL